MFIFYFYILIFIIIFVIMKTKIGHYYVFFTLEDFWNKVNYWKSKKIYWVEENHPDYKPNISQYDLPCVLNVDKKYMGWGKIETHKERYFKIPLFVTLYTKELRKLKLRKIDGSR